MNSLTVLLISYVVYICESIVLARGPVRCYECSTLRQEHYCGDPFNFTAPGIRITTCQEACVKWVRRPKYGPVHYIRTCAESLNLRMHWAHVCMTESRPGDGRLCFCDDNYCNGASPFHHRQLASYVIASPIVYYAVRAQIGYGHSLSPS